MNSSIDQRVKKVAMQVMKLYSTGDGQEKANLIRNYYRMDAFFEDPVVKVRGERKLFLQFLALSRMFYAIDVQYTVQDWPVAMVESGESNGGLRCKFALVSVESQQAYYPTRWCLEFAYPIRLKVTTILRIDLNRMQVEWHRDKWDGNRQLPNLWRQLIGYVTCAAFYLMFYPLFRTLIV